MQKESRVSGTLRRARDNGQTKNEKKANSAAYRVRLLAARRRAKRQVGVGGENLGKRGAVEGGEGEGGGGGTTRGPSASQGGKRAYTKATHLPLAASPQSPRFPAGALFPRHRPPRHNASLLRTLMCRCGRASRALNLGRCCSSGRAARGGDKKRVSLGRRGTSLACPAVHRRLSFRWRSPLWLSLPLHPYPVRNLSLDAWLWAATAPRRRRWSVYHVSSLSTCSIEKRADWSASISLSFFPRAHGSGSLALDISARVCGATWGS